MADRELGVMVPVTLEELEATGFVGVGTLEDFSRLQMIEIDEIAATGAKTVAVGCPFCLTMLNDGLADRGADVKVRDIAEILADGLSPPATAGEKGSPA